MQFSGFSRPYLKFGLPLVAAGLVATACSSGTTSSTSSAAAAAPVASSSAPATTATITLTNGHLTDATGRTVYLWLADTGAQSTCSGACATVWPPVPAPASATAGGGATSADLTTITRSDGTKQLDYAGHPLYYFQGDKSAGSTAGQGIDGFGAKWWEVSASGSAITTASSPSSASPATSSSSNGYNY
jgi:predicted lipoprotein with Yx(FWY)xxD motif